MREIRSYVYMLCEQHTHAHKHTHTHTYNIDTVSSARALSLAVPFRLCLCVSVSVLFSVSLFLSLSLSLFSFSLSLYVYIYIYIYIHVMYIHVFIHTYIHTYIHNTTTGFLVFKCCCVRISRIFFEYTPSFTLFCLSYSASSWESAQRPQRSLSCVIHFIYRRQPDLSRLISFEH